MLPRLMSEKSTFSLKIIDLFVSFDSISEQATVILLYAISQNNLIMN
jgi:hypothetical protein